MEQIGRGTRVLQITRKALVSSLLFWAVVPLLASAPRAGDQSLTTITSLQTNTTYVTVPKVSAIRTAFMTSTRMEPLRFNTYPLSYHSASGTLFMENPPSGFCVFYSFSFLAKAGQQISDKITSDGMVNFYVMSEKQFQAWRAVIGGEGGCTGMTALLAKAQLTTYSLDWIVPEDGEYRFVFLSKEHTSGYTTISFRPNTVSAVSVASTVYATILSTMTRTFVSSTIHVEEVAQPFSLGQNVPLIAGVSGMVVLVVLVLVASRSGLRKKTASGASIKTQAVSKLYCVNCGAELRSESKFCIGCGSPTT